MPDELLQWEVFGLPRAAHDLGITDLFKTHAWKQPNGCIMPTDKMPEGVKYLDKPLTHDCMWEFRQRGNYFYVRPRNLRDWLKWPSQRGKGKAKWAEWGQSLHSVLIEAYADITYEQTDISEEKTNGYELDLVHCHLCGNSLCIRPAHLGKQTRYQDCLDRAFHRHNRGKIRPAILNQMQIA